MARRSAWSPQESTASQCGCGHARLPKSQRLGQRRGSQPGRAARQSGSCRRDQSVAIAVCLGHRHHVRWRANLQDRHIVADHVQVDDGFGPQHPRSPPRARHSSAARRTQRTRGSHRAPRPCAGRRSIDNRDPSIIVGKRLPVISEVGGFRTPGWPRSVDSCDGGPRRRADFERSRAIRFGCGLAEFRLLDDGEARCVGRLPDWIGGVG